MDGGRETGNGNCTSKKNLRSVKYKDIRQKKRGRQIHTAHLFVWPLVQIITCLNLPLLAMNEKMVPRENSLQRAFSCSYRV